MASFISSRPSAICLMCLAINRRRSGLSRLRPSSFDPRIKDTPMFVGLKMPEEDLTACRRYMISNRLFWTAGPGPRCLTMRLKRTDSVRG